MDTSNLDLSRFRRMTRKKYYITDWKVTPEEAEFAKELDRLTPLERHNFCHERSNLKKESSASEDWNLWACYFRDRYLKDVNTDTGKGLFGTRKELKAYFIMENEKLNIKFGDPSNNRININGLSCENFLFPYFADIGNIQLTKKSSFANAHFCGYANFSSSYFSNVVDFNRTKFYDIANFESANFSSYSHFVGTNFIGNADFSFTNFTDKVYFTSVNFMFGANFTSSAFSAPVSFKYSKFYGIADFSTCKFFQNSKLKSCYFFEDFIFNEVVGEKTVDFSASCFLAESNFEGSHFMSSAIFHRCAFGTITKNQVNKFTPSKLKNSINTYRGDPQNDIIPDFTSANFTIPPNLSYIDMPSVLEDTQEMTASKFRRLKELANAGQNHIEEAEFFRLEMLARRDHEVQGIQANLITVYEWVSKCGLSIKRPFSH